MKPNNDLRLHLARIGRHVLSQRSAHASNAVIKLAPLAALTPALAVVVSVVHGAVGAHAAPVQTAYAPPLSASSATPVDVSVSNTPPRERITIARRSLNVLEGHSLSVAGALRPALAHARVLLQERHDGHWHTVAHTHTGSRGRFDLRYVPGRMSTVALRVSTQTATRKVGMLNVYREAIASWYGGGGSLACGGELTSSTLGVANKTLPCGTLVTLRYGDRSVRVPVVDRGPYVPGREFDLTEATKQALGFPGLGAVWSSR